MRSFFKTVWLPAALIVALTGCATATGPAFTELAPVPLEKANIYIYRKFAIFGAGAASEVNINGKRVGELPNASYVVYSLPPGRYFINVGGLKRHNPSTRALKIEAGRNYFLQYDISDSSFTPRPYLSTFEDVRRFDERSETTALADIKDLKRAH